MPVKRNLFTGVQQLDGWKGQQNIKTFKIALKEREVDTWIDLDLSDDLRLERVRDLFLLEIFTGQRYSDVDKVLDRNNHDGGLIRIYQQKTGEMVPIPIHAKLDAHLQAILKKYPNGLPTITNQKFNDYLKEIGERAGFNQKHSWEKLVGKKRITESDFRYNLITTHTGRRTFATHALKRRIPAELIMKVTGHRKYDQFTDYVKCDDEDVELAFAEKF